ncbi:MAG: SAM-dependent methyltransferase [Gemmatimonadota bacterium]
MNTQWTNRQGAANPESTLGRFDPTVPSPARVWDYFVGGKDNFAVDRALAEQMLEVGPALPVVARLTRQFIRCAVEELVTVYGVRQFLDIGSGLPTAENTHEVAQQAAPESRIVYVDNDPVVIRHAEALLHSTPEGACASVDADLRDPDVIVAEAARTLDFGKPVALMLIQVLHFIPDSDDPYGIVARLMAALPPGSFLVMVHGASDLNSKVNAELTRRYNNASSAQLSIRTFEEFSRFFNGLEPVGPGLVSGLEWLQTRGGELPHLSPGMTIGHSGIARKP